MSDAPSPPPRRSRATKKKELPEHFKAYKHVWVIVELERGQCIRCPGSSWAKLASSPKARRRGRAVVVGGPHAGVREAAADSFAYGADVAYVVENPVLDDYRNESYTRAMTELVNKYKPEILLLGATISAATSRARSPPRCSPG